MGIGPIVAAAGLLLLAAMGTHPQYGTNVLPGVVLLGIGLSITVAPLTAAILSAAPSTHSGIASGINNAVARVAGLIAIAVVGAVVASSFSSQIDQRLARPGAPAAYRLAVARAASTTLQTRVPAGFTSAQRTHVHRALAHASVDAFRLATLIAAALALASGILSLLGIATKETV
jgi:hypothetical protein